MGYFFESNLQSGQGTVVRITPYIGLAYYDGASDGVYNTSTGTFNLSTATHPNLYNGNNEYGNYVQGNPIVLGFDNFLNNWYTHELAVFSPEDHCPIRHVNIGYNFNLQSVNLNIVNNAMVQPLPFLGYPITPAPSTGTSFEEDLLAQYGKVFYYKIEFGRDHYNFDETFYIPVLAAKPSVEDVTEWTNLSMSDNFGNNLYYHSNGLPTTYELVVDADALNSSASFNFIIPGEIFDTANYGSQKVMIKGDNSYGWGTFMDPNAIIPGKNIHIRFCTEPFHLCN